VNSSEVAQKSDLNAGDMQTRGWLASGELASFLRYPGRLVPVHV
jgi:hypothetical protein